MALAVQFIPSLRSLAVLASFQIWGLSAHVDADSWPAEALAHPHMPGTVPGGYPGFRGHLAEASQPQRAMEDAGCPKGDDGKLPVLSSPGTTLAADPSLCPLGGTRPRRRL